MSKNAANYARGIAGLDMRALMLEGRRLDSEIERLERLPLACRANHVRLLQERLAVLESALASKYAQ